MFSEFPPIADDDEREKYKHIFDTDHQEYKSLQAELDVINKRLAEVDRELDELQEGTPQYQVKEILGLLSTTLKMIDRNFLSNTCQIFKNEAYC